MSPGTGAGAARPRRAAVLSCVLPLVALPGACGDPQPVASNPSTSSTSTTSTSTTSTSTSTVAPTSTSTPKVQYDPASLPPCGTTESYRTVPDWLPGTIPEGLALRWAATSVVGSIGDVPGQVQAELQLADVDADDRLVADLGVRRHELEGFEIDPANMAGSSADPAADHLDSVRGHAGRVARHINRGDSWGASGARWIEGGAGWSASSRMLGVAELAAALEPLHLEPGAEADVSGRFRVLGRAAGQFHGAGRQTEIGLVTASSTPADREVLVTVYAAAEGSDGVLAIDELVRWPPPDAPEVLVSEVDGRVHLSNGFASVTALEDGTQVAVRGRTEAVPGMDGELEPQLSEGALRALVDGLVRVDPGEDRLRRVPLSGIWNQQREPDRLQGYCRET